MWTYKVSKTETQKSGVLLLLEGWHGETEGVCNCAFTGHKKQYTQG